MPLSVRRSKKMGPVRVNLSRSGVGASVGVKGARIGSGPRGTYVRVGRQGIFYRQRLGQANARAAAPPAAPGETVTTADVDDLVDSSSTELLHELNQPQGGWLTRLFKRPAPSAVNYELDEDSGAQFGRLQEALARLASADQLWLIETSTETQDRKHHAGATALVARRPIRAGRLNPPGIASNVDIYGIDAGSLQLYFFPDRLLVRQSKRYGAVDYTALTARRGETDYREEGMVPSDATVIGSTWRYVNKSGGPDKRFADNRQIPIALYGIVELAAANGLQLRLHVSNKAAGDECANGIAQFVHRFSQA
jgi:Protein of unknown function (DUF4236)